MHYGARAAIINTRSTLTRFRALPGDAARATGAGGSGGGRGGGGESGGGGGSVHRLYALRARCILSTCMHTQKVTTNTYLHVETLCGLYLSIPT